MDDCMKIHSSITQEVILGAMENDDYVGFCLACGTEACQVEPDAREYKCVHCGDLKVYGAEEICLMMVGWWGIHVSSVPGQEGL